MESDLLEQSLRGSTVPAPAEASSKKPQVEDSDVSSFDDQEEILPRPVRNKRPNCRYTEWSSDDEYCLRALKRSFPKYKEVDSSSESESDFIKADYDALLNLTDLPIGVIRGCAECSDCQTVLAKWRPEEGCKPSVNEAPVFYPTEEEFKDTLKYIAKIRPAAEPFGICRVVTPPGWEPPCPLREDSAKLHILKFPTRVQEIHKLQVRKPAKNYFNPKQRLGGRRGKGVFRGRMGPLCRRSPNSSAKPGQTKELQQDESFGFEPGSYFSLKMFEDYADQFKEQYFRDLNNSNELQGRVDLADYSGLILNPSVDAIEAEYWRIVEQPTDQIEVLYGADVETGSFGSGFPKAKDGSDFSDLNSYEKSGWNLNNIARLPGSMLAFEEGDISGVLVPWLYVGMCFSSFCWHVEDHHFYSLNYLHWGAPKVWYGVAGHAADDMEAAMKKHLPELFEEQPDLLHKLVTQLSPSVLKEEGLPVCRLVQQAGEFVITFPRAYHSGFNCGFNCAEAVNLAPIDWLPHGQSAVELYREQRRKTSVSHDKLLLAAAREAVTALQMHQSQQNCMQGLCIKGERVGIADRAIDYGNTWLNFCGQGGVLVEALKVRVGLERSRQASLSGEMQMKKMDRSFDATDERECAECHYDLHLSAVGCECSPDKYVCLAHAERLCACHWGRKSLLYRCSLTQLEDLVAVLEKQPEALSTGSEHKEVPNPSSTIGAGPRPGLQTSGSLASLGICEFNSADYPPDGIEFTKNRIQLTMENSERNSLSSFKMREDNFSVSQQVDGDMDVKSVLPQQINLGDSVHIAPAHLVATFVADISDMDKKASGTSVEVQSILSDPVMLQKKTGEGAPLTNRKDFILLSDDEENLCVTGSAEERPSKKAHKEDGNYFIPSGMSWNSSDTSGGSLDRPAAVVEEGLPGSQDGQPPVLSLSKHIAGEALQTLTSIRSQLTPPMTSRRIPSALMQTGTTRTAPLLPPPVRCRSIGSLKQQARAASAQHSRSRSKLSSSPLRVDHLHRLRSGNDMSGAVLCGQVPTPDTQPPYVEVGDAHPLTSVSVEQIGGPRAAEIVPKRVFCEVELLNVGSLVHREGWHNAKSIFPAGFKSRTSFCSIVNIFQTCSYISEIVDSKKAGPCFKVSVEGSSVTVVDDSIDICWQAVQRQINREISRRLDMGESNLPLLRPSQSICGLDMFGLTSATIVQLEDGGSRRRKGIVGPVCKFVHTGMLKECHVVRLFQAIEALDPHHQCCEYWTARSRMAPRPTSDDGSAHGPKCLGTTVEVATDPILPAAQSNSKHVLVECPSEKNGDFYRVLRGYFQNGKPDELSAMHQLFNCEWQGKEWREGFQALTDVLESRLP